MCVRTQTCEKCGQLMLLNGVAVVSHTAIVAKRDELVLWQTIQKISSLHTHFDVATAALVDLWWRVLLDAGKESQFCGPTSDTNLCKEPCVSHFRHNILPSVSCPAVAHPCFLLTVPARWAVRRLDFGCSCGRITCFGYVINTIFSTCFQGRTASLCLFWLTALDCNLWPPNCGITSFTVTVTLPFGVWCDQGSSSVYGCDQVCSRWCGV
jgi:hypothetical protein